MNFSLQLALAVSVSLPTIAAAQGVRQASQAGPVRDAGTLHLATGTWTRATQMTQSLIGTDVLYDNSCSALQFAGLDGDTFVDEGRLPSPSAPAPTGCSTSYRIDGFTFGYCTDQTSATLGTFTHRFYDNYAPCTAFANLTPTATIAVNGMPAAPTAGVLQCWNVTIDLAGTGAGSFLLAADGDGTFSGGNNDHFGWAISSTAPGFMTGPLIAGAPFTCAPGAGTAFSPALGPGTGLGNSDFFFIGNGPTAPGCYFFGGSPFGGFRLTLQGKACESFPAQTVYCAGDGSATACPCGNASAAGAGVGCLNSINLGGKLRTFGTPSLSNDSLVLLGSGMTPSPCLYSQGTTFENGGSGTVFGDGLRCISGTIIRLGTKLQTPNGTSQYPGLFLPPISVIGGVTAPGTRTYQGWYRDTPSFCTTDGFNLTNGVEVVWGL